MDKNSQIILASNSPRRKEILEKLGFSFEVKACPLEEPEVMNLKDCLKGAEFKAKTVAEELIAKGTAIENTIVIGSDTVVCLGDKILGKPADKKTATQMLNDLSGKSHIVASSLSVIHIDASGKMKIKTDLEKTEIKFRKLSSEEIERYVASEECMDKAGSYAIQEGISSTFIESINGCYNNVVGLPVSLLLNML